MIRIIVGISGSSGAIYGARLVEVLSEVDHVETHLIMTNGARATLSYETDVDPRRIVELADVAYDDSQVGAAIASGMFVTAGMVVAPCSMTSVTEVGGVVLPPIPGLYTQPSSVADVVDHAVTKILDQFDVDAKRIPRWQGIS